MILQYGQVTLDELVVQRWEHVATYDGPNFIYPKHRIAVRGILNPSVISAIAGPVPKRGQLPAVTLAAIRQYMLQPRRALTVAMGPTFLLKSPAAGQSIDAHNGPTPISCTVTEVHGFRTIFVDYVIETCLNECPTPHAVLSNVWEMTHDVDQDGFTTRHIKGRAVFNTGALLKLAARPDEFRLALTHLIPDNFKRMQVRATVEPDGNTLLYEIFDRERYLNYLGREIGVSRVGGFHEYTNGRRGTGENSTAALEKQRRISGIAALEARAAGSLKGVIEDGIKTGGISVFPALGVGIGSFLDDKALIEIESKWREYPRAKHHLLVDVVGNRNALRSDLTRFANRVMVTRLGRIQQPCHDITYRLWHDLAEGHVIVECTMMTPPLPGVDVGQRISLDDGNLMPPPFPDFNEDPGVLVKNQVGQPFTTDNEGRIRGTYREQVIAAALLGPCDAVASPPATPLATPTRNAGD